MKKKQNSSIFLLLIMGIFLIFTSSCEKDDDNNPPSNNPTNGQTTAVFNPGVIYGTMTGQDGNMYKTVTIGTQTWMAENLRTTKYNDGTAIPNVTHGGKWGTLTTGAYCNYNNTTHADSIATFGRLYNWYTVNTGKLAPKGWHVPTDAEWTVLTDYLGDESVSGGKLKEIYTTHWKSPNKGATNETGFTALPGGYRYGDGTFYDVGKLGDWWSSTESNATDAWGRAMNFDYSDVLWSNGNKGDGISVRCLRD